MKIGVNIDHYSSTVSSQVPKSTCTPHDNTFILPWSCLVAGSCGSYHSVDVCWWVGSVFPGWLGAAGCFHAAWPLGKPAWPPAELRTTAAKSERQVERDRQV